MVSHDCTLRLQPFPGSEVPAGQDSGGVGGGVGEGQGAPADHPLNPHHLKDKSINETDYCISTVRTLVTAGVLVTTISPARVQL